MPINNLIYRENLDIELGGELLTPPELSHLKIASKQVLVPPPKLCHCRHQSIGKSLVLYLTVTAKVVHYYVQ